MAHTSVNEVEEQQQGKKQKKQISCLKLEAWIPYTL